MPAIAVDDAVLVSAPTCECLGADPPIALPRPHLPALAPLAVTDPTFADSAERMDTGSPAPQPMQAMQPVKSWRSHARWPVYGRSGTLGEAYRSGSAVSVQFGVKQVIRAG
ncbi:hypothetical protein [Streptomyces sp. NPDC054783]